MTMADNKCEVCFRNPPIGVACTIIPYSCAYCEECARRLAQPLLVCESILLDIEGDLSKIAGPFLEMQCFYDGRYMTFREWTGLRQKEK